jgi:6-phosphofructo-2-kinase
VKLCRHRKDSISRPPLCALLYTFDKTILQNNVRLKLFGPDYRNQDQGPALTDFIQRVANYERSYVPLGAFEEQQRLSYVSMIDVGRKIETHLIQGLLSTQVVEYLLNFNLAERQIWLTCNGESVDDRVGRIGRNAELTDHGRAYATALEHFIRFKREEWEKSRQKNPCTTQFEELHAIAFEGQRHHQRPHQQADSDRDEDATPTMTTTTACTCATLSTPLHIWTSTMPQCIQTGVHFSPTLYQKRQWTMLDDLNAGDMAGLTFPEVEALHPSVFSARRRNRLLYRWPGLGGEAYIDAINRMRGVIIELERVKHNVLLITHRAIVRVLLGYFLGIDNGDLADLRIPKDGVFCIEPVCRFYFPSLFLSEDRR